jgi:hypothetical protein
MDFSGTLQESGMGIEKERNKVSLQKLTGQTTR